MFIDHFKNMTPGPAGGEQLRKEFGRAVVFKKDSLYIAKLPSLPGALYGGDVFFVKSDDRGFLQLKSISGGETFLAKDKSSGIQPLEAPGVSVFDLEFEYGPDDGSVQIFGQKLQRLSDADVHQLIKDLEIHLLPREHKIEFAFKVSSGELKKYSPGLFDLLPASPRISFATGLVISENPCPAYHFRFFFGVRPELKEYEVIGIIRSRDGSKVSISTEIGEFTFKGFGHNELNEMKSVDFFPAEGMKENTAYTDSGTLLGDPGLAQFRGIETFTESDAEELIRALFSVHGEFPPYQKKMVHSNVMPAFQTSTPSSEMGQEQKIAYTAGGTLVDSPELAAIKKELDDNEEPPCNESDAPKNTLRPKPSLASLNEVSEDEKLSLPKQLFFILIGLLVGYLLGFFI